MVILFFFADKAQYFATFKGSNELAVKLRNEKYSVTPARLHTVESSRSISPPSAAVDSGFEYCEDALQFNNRYERLIELLYGFNKNLLRNLAIAMKSEHMSTVMKLVPRRSATSVCQHQKLLQIYWLPKPYPT